MHRTLNPLDRRDLLRAAVIGGTGLLFRSHMRCFAAHRLFSRLWLGMILALPVSAWASEDPEPPPSRGDWVSAGLPTWGGKQFWTDHFVCDQGRIQQNVLTKHYRLLDSRDRHQASGSLERCRTALDQLRSEQQPAEQKSQVVITLHGLGRTRQSMEGIGQYLADQGGWGWINMGYASTRDNLAAHAAALHDVVGGLQGVEQVNFVAHSLGNLVVRHYLADRAQRTELPDGYPSVGRIVMLAPPNQGSALARQLKDQSLFRLLLGAGGRQLTSGWAELEQKLAIPSGQYGIIAASVGRATAGNPVLEGRDDLVVSVEETRLAGAHDFLEVQATHTFLMNSPAARQATLRFLQHGYFVSDEQRQPIAR